MVNHVLQARYQERLRIAMSEILLREEANLYNLAGLVAVSRVEVSSSLEDVKFYLSILDDDPERRKQVLALLKENSKKIRFLLVQKVVCKKAPNIRFVLDEQLEEARRIDQQLRALKAVDINKINE